VNYGIFFKYSTCEDINPHLKRKGCNEICGHYGKRIRKCLPFEIKLIRNKKRGDR
jgi:hypothetical protein